MEKTSFCTLAQAKTLLDVTASDYTQDNPQLITCLGIAADQIVTYVGRNFVRREETDYFSLPTRAMNVKLFTRATPVVSGSVTGKYGSQSGSSVAYVATDPGSITEYDPETGYMIYNWRGGYGNGLILSYTGGLEYLADTDLGDGWKTFDSPSDLQQANAIQAAHVMNKFLGNKSGKEEKGSNKSSRFTIIPEVQQIINKYRRPSYMGI